MIIVDKKCTNYVLQFFQSKLSIEYSFKFFSNQYDICRKFQSVTVRKGVPIWEFEMKFQFSWCFVEVFPDFFFSWMLAIIVYKSVPKRRSEDVWILNQVIWSDSGAQFFSIIGMKSLLSLKCEFQSLIPREGLSEFCLLSKWWSIMLQKLVSTDSFFKKPQSYKISNNNLWPFPLFHISHLPILLVKIPNFDDSCQQ